MELEPATNGELCSGGLITRPAIKAACIRSTVQTATNKKPAVYAGWIQTGRRPRTSFENCHLIASNAGARSCQKVEVTSVRFNVNRLRYCAD